MSLSQECGVNPNIYSIHRQLYYHIYNMKKFFRLASLAVAAALFLLPGVAKAQGENPMMAPLPVDTAVRMGHLPNGLTYYIRHNEYPKGQADFYIAQNVGSALEEDNQRGLAHFLEHMCFNGTTNFPGNQLRDWLASVGVRFGENLNAYTGVDETVYNISNVPVARESVQDSCLLILHDWANDLTLDPKEIDKERGVIHEEWRRSTQGQMRIIENVLPNLYPTTKYGHRLPIGTMEVVDNFPHQALRDYYETWYRPDQQAIIVVGDIDVDRIENKIKEMFSPIEMPANAKPRTYEPVPDHKGMLYGIGSDPEQKSLVAQLFFISDPMPRELKNTMVGFLTDYCQTMIQDMLDNRLNELSMKPDAPFAGAGVSFGEYFLTKSKDALTGFVAAKGNDIVEPLQALYRELLRAQRGGFTQSEYERARSQYLSNIEKFYNNRATRENDSYVQEYVRNFTDGEAIPGIEVEWPLLQQLSMMVNVDMINQAMAETITPDNRALLVLSPEGEGFTLPTEAAIDAALAAVDAEQIDAFVDEVKSEPLITKAPVAGKIVSTVDNKTWGTIEWTLSNGAKVIVKPTKFKEDEIRFGAQAIGGYANYPDSYANTVIFFPISLRSFGLGTYSRTDLEKYTAGKQADLYFDIAPYRTQLGGSTTPKDLPTLMELLYMSFVDLEFTSDEFDALQKAYSGFLANQEKSPEYIFGRDVAKALYASPFRQSLSSEAILGASREQTVEIVHNVTANAANYTFYFVGNVDPETLKPLVETYIASLPGDPSKTNKEATPNPAFFTKAGSGTDTFTTSMTTPQSQVLILENAKIPYSAKDAIIADIAGQILTKRLIDTVREEMGAVYSIYADGRLSRESLWTATLASQFPMKPEMKKEVLDFIHGQFKAMESDVTAEELNPIKEYLVKTYTENKEKNGSWLGSLMGFGINGVDTFNGNIDTVNSITVNDVMNFMKNVNGQDNYRVVVLDPAE